MTQHQQTFTGTQGPKHHPHHAASRTPGHQLTMPQWRPAAHQPSTRTMPPTTQHPPIRNPPPVAPPRMVDAPTVQFPRVTDLARPDHPAEPTPAAGPPKTKADALRQDVLASIVVFLVALPLCIGIAVASGVKPEAAIITGIVGGLVTGLMPGSTLQVSGPAAGLTVLVLDAVQHHGAHTLGMIVLLSGVLQILMGLLRIGAWFQAIASSVVAGMLAGIGVLILVGQIYALADQKSRGNAMQNLLGLPGLVQTISVNPAAQSAIALGVIGLAVMVLWKKVPKPLQSVPGALAAVVVVTALAPFLHLGVRKLNIGSLAAAIDLPDIESISALADASVIGTALAFALIASAESLFSATAIDQMHDGPKTKHDLELMAQGSGNLVSGFLGGLPLTAVVVRSAANVHAGAKTKLSRVLHGVWMLAFAVLAPGILKLIPLTVLAAILVYSGWKLFNPKQFAAMWRIDRGEAMIMIVTAVAIVATDLLEGVIIGLVIALAKLAWRMSHLTLRQRQTGHGTVLTMTGSATFLAVPKLNRELEKMPAGPAHVDMSALLHVDRTCRGAVENWSKQRRKGGDKVTIALPPGADEHFEDVSSH